MAAPETPGYRRISPEEAHALVDDGGYLYLDVRSEPEFAQGHPKGAYNVPLQQPGPGGMVDNDAFVAVVRASFPTDTPLCVGCRSGNRSQRAADLLVEAGYARVVEQRAGFSGTRDPFGRPGEPGWQAAGLPTATTPEPGRDYPSLLKKRGRASPP